MSASGSAATYDALIVGAGIIGAACADALTREGLKVAVVEGDAVASGATGAAMGHVVVMDDSEPQFALTRYSQQLWMALRHELPADVEYQQCGTLWIAADDEEMTEVVLKNRYYADRKVRTEVINSRTLEELEPNLRKGLAGALLVLEDAVIHPLCAAQFLIERAKTRGAQLFLGSSVSRIEEGAVRLDNGRRLSAGVIVNAAGVGSRGLTPGLAVRTRKGHLAITDRHPGFVRHQVVELGYLKSAHSLETDSVAFNVQPRTGGQILIGSSRQYDNDCKQLDEAILARMLQRAAEYMPSLAQTSTVRSWAGLRAATPDKLPFIGPWPENKSLFLATGHEGLGITTSLATSELIADRILNRNSAIPFEPYLPARMLRKESHA